MSLGVFEEAKQPKGFSIGYHSHIENPEQLEIEITSQKVANGLLYVLRIANNTQLTLCAEIRAL